MSSDLRRRIPAAVLYVISIGVCFLLNSVSAIVLLWIFFAFCLFEYLSVEFGEHPVMIVLLTVASHGIVSLGITGQLPPPYLLILCSCVVGGLLWNALHLINTKRAGILNMPRTLATLFYLTLPFLIVITMCHEQPEFLTIVLGTFIIIWLNDAGAYFVGRAYGKHKIFPSVSPGKTWEGFWGGMIVGIIVSIAVARVFGAMNYPHWMLLACVLAITGILGDLTESSWKRHHEIKDSSQLFPGHGGFLDRLDSFIYSIPFVALIYLVS
ncbi:MAG: phosphatidate cytidylyltransferase [Bacteroidota bacterium]